MSDSILKKTKDNLAKIPARSWKVMGTVLLIPGFVTVAVLYSAFTRDSDSTSTPSTKTEKGEAYLGTAQVSGVVTQKEGVSSEYMKTLKAEEQKQEAKVMSGKTTSGAFIATPDVFDVEDTGFKPEDFKELKGETQTLEEPPETKAEPAPKKTPIDEPEPKPEPKKQVKKTPIDEPEPNARQSTGSQPLSDAEKARQAAYKEELARVFKYAQTLTQKDNEMIAKAAASTWQKTYEDVSPTSTQAEPVTTATSAPSTSKSYGNNRDKIGYPALLPGDRLLAEVVGNVNSDRPSKIVYRVSQGALMGAEIIGDFKAQRDVPVIELSTITWNGHTGVIKGVATDPMNNNNYVTGDVNYHTLARWTALASSYLVKGFSTALSLSGTTVSKDINGNETTSRPEYTTEELWIQAGGALANKGADIAGAYFDTPPTVKLHDGDVFGILIFEAMDYDWLPPIKKGTDVL